MDKEKIQKMVDSANKRFCKDESGLVAEICSTDTMVVCIDIEFGDWKHEHSYADSVMRRNGFKKVTEQLTEASDTDCYSSIHYYLYFGK